MSAAGGAGRALWGLAALLAIVAAGTPAAGEGSPAASRASAEAASPSVDPSRRYLFYLHGRILELRGRYAVSKRHGPYDYDGILRAFADRNFVVLSEIRPAETTLGYGERIAGQVHALLAAGVPPGHVTVVGFSKGGMLTMVASAAAGQPKVNFAVLAGCGIGPWRGEILRTVAPRLQGRILSLYDEADQEAGSCQEGFALATGLDAKEVRLRTGLGHGLFYAPRKEWLDLVSDWASGRP